MEYDELIAKATNDNVDILEVSFKGKAKGYYSDGVIAIDNKIETNTEKKCILAEELGHFYTSTGDILDNSILSKKKESIARRWACEKLITLSHLTSAFKDGITNKSDLANYLDVTPHFLDLTLEYYKRRYGTHVKLNNYIIFFEPNLGILKLL
ncbi:MULTISPECIES: ImmA/IrrE family metallo-endopeptidase [Clostridium]|uniref:IrrE N-terminal-like domain-containing protein n=1 Tax=Clostridium cibarium TaxID=2762247 RepID=A0ABR8PV60_9CLOT|nr:MULTISPECIES: ImmA/IrrE family metallo-endopeptidase [Clostridium]MBD7912023.1 hypothetical protein [Clostridium cibarium]